MRVEYENQPGDFRETLAAFPPRQRWLWKLEGLGYFALCSIPPVCLTAAFENWFGLAAGLSLTAAWAIYQVFIKAMNFDINTVLLRKMAVILEPEFLRVEIEHGWTERDWSTVEEIRETDKYLLVFVSKVHFYPVSKSAFTSVQQLDSFRTQLQHFMATHRDRTRPRFMPAPVELEPPDRPAGSDSMQVTFQNKARDFFDANQRAAAPGRGRSNRSGSIVAAIVLVGFSVMMLNAFRDGHSPLLQVMLGLVAFLALLLATLVALLPLFRVRQAKFVDPIELERKSMTIAADGIRIVSPGCNRFATWQMISRVDADSKTVVFYDIRPLSYCVIPLVAFNNQDEANEFARLATTYQAATQPNADVGVPAIEIADTGNPYQPPAAM
ncbi:MAG: YcxB family protein [Planctomycetota bacterium]|nr:YcxB family protein [Planctomycetota bacterium]